MIKTALANHGRSAGVIDSAGSPLIDTEVIWIGLHVFPCLLRDEETQKYFIFTIKFHENSA